MKNISDAAEEAVGEAQMSGRAQVFLDCDPDYKQAKVTVGLVQKVKINDPA